MEGDLNLSNRVVAPPHLAPERILSSKLRWCFHHRSFLKELVGAQIHNLIIAHLIEVLYQKNLKVAFCKMDFRADNPERKG